MNPGASHKDKRPAHFCECGNHAWIVLTRGFCALIDPEFAPAATLWNWYAHPDKQNLYARRTHKQKIAGYKKSFTVRLHHVVLPAPYGYVVDHVNGNGLDNRISNLRLASDSQNATNKRNASTAASQYRGVARTGSRWYALISKSGKQTYLGVFDTEEEAAAAYDRAAVAVHGEFARLNFPEQMRSVA